MGLIENRKRQLAEAARPLLQPDETVEQVAFCQTRVPVWATVLLLGPLFAKPHAIAATNRNLYVFRLHPFRLQPTIIQATRHALGSVAVARKGRSLRVDGRKYYVLLGPNQKDADALVGALAEKALSR